MHATFLQVLAGLITSYLPRSVVRPLFTLEHIVATVPCPVLQDARGAMPPCFARLNRFSNNTWSYCFLRLDGAQVSQLPTNSSSRHYTSRMQNP